MNNKLLLAAGLIAVCPTLALAQGRPGNAAPPPPPGHAPPPPGHGHAGHRKPHGPPPGHGFELKTGRGKGLRVDCGPEPIKACIDAAKPLLDRLGDAPRQPYGDDDYDDED